MESPQREWNGPDATPGFDLLLKRNCSISPAGLGAVFGLLAAVTLAIGIGFAFAGAWLVLPFAGLEAALLGGAFLWCARHASDRERIALEAGSLRVEIVRGACTERYALDAAAASVRLLPDARLVVSAAGTSLELGRHLDAAARVGLATELSKRLGI